MVTGNGKAVNPMREERITAVVKGKDPSTKITCVLLPIQVGYRTQCRRTLVLLFAPQGRWIRMTDDATITCLLCVIGKDT